MQVNSYKKAVRSSLTAPKKIRPWGSAHGLNRSQLYTGVQLERSGSGQPLRTRPNDKLSNRYALTARPIKRFLPRGKYNYL